MEPLLFYRHDEPYGEFSNYYSAPVRLDGVEWPTTEHYYQAQKFSGTAYAEAIRNSPYPADAKRRAHSRRSEYRPDWSEVKDAVMRDCVRAKFVQHPELRSLLCATGERLLVEHTERDGYWGDGGDGSGLNRLGEILMEIRAELCGRPS